MKSREVVLCSKNKAKEEAVRNFLDAHYESQYELVCIESSSGVSATPTSDDEGIEGAIRRIENVKRIVNAETYIGLEGVITKNRYGTFVCGWAVVMTEEDTPHIGCSAKVRLPDSIASQISSSEPLSDITARYFPDRVQELGGWGTNGVITNGLYTRVDEFTDALRCAFGTMTR